MLDHGGYGAHLITSSNIIVIAPMSAMAPSSLLDPRAPQHATDYLERLIALGAGTAGSVVTTPMNPWRIDRSEPWRLYHIDLSIAVPSIVGVKGARTTSVNSRLITASQQQRAIWILNVPCVVPSESVARTWGLSHLSRCLQTTTTDHQPSGSSTPLYRLLDAFRLVLASIHCLELVSHEAESWAGRAQAS